VALSQAEQKDEGGKYFGPVQAGATKHDFRRALKQLLHGASEKLLGHAALAWTSIRALGTPWANLATD
jgi:hypothetical protein